LPERGREVESFDAAAGPAPFVTVAPDDYGGTMELLEHARRHDADHADVPHQLAFDDDVVGGGIEFTAQGVDGVVGDVALDLLAFAVASVETVGDRFGGGEVTGEHQG